MDLSTSGSISTAAVDSIEPSGAIIYAPQSTGLFPINNLQPTLALTQLVSFAGTMPSNGSPGGADSYWSMGAIHHFAGNFAPSGTAIANGGTYSIANYSAMYSLLGTTFGGNGTSTFALPDFRGTLEVGMGQGSGLSLRSRGQFFGGEDAVSLPSTQLPSAFGGSAAFDTTQHSLGTNYVINVRGTYETGGAMNMLGTVWNFVGGYAPGDMMPCDGRLLPISEYEDLFQLIGTTYGGNGQETFALPDLRGRTIIGWNPGSNNVGDFVGAETVQLTTANMPAAMGGTATPIANVQPGLVMSYLFALSGVFPGTGTQDGAATFEGDARVLGEIVAYAGTVAPTGYAMANGQLLPINQNQALFSILGTTYGGNGSTNFALPDLRGRSIIGANEQHILGQRDGATTVTLTMNNIPSVTVIDDDIGHTLYGSSNSDIINGNGGNDTLNGNGGQDILIGGPGDDILNGAGGAIASYSTAPSGVVVNLSVVGAQNTVGAGIDTLNGISGIIGSSYVDTLTGNSGANQIDGGAGNDFLYGLDGDDTLDGGAGDDFLDGGIGTDTASYEAAASGVTVNLTTVGAQNTGGGGVDTLVSIERLIGSNWNDTLTGDSGANYLSGGSGNDILNGNGGADSLNGGLGDDIYIVNNAGVSIGEVFGPLGGIDQVWTTLASFTLPGEVEILRFTGVGGFTGTGNAQANTIYGGAGSDNLSGLAGNDIFYLDAGGADTANGGDNDDIFYYGAALGAGDQNDGGNGSDTMVLQGNVALTLTAANMVNFEGISLQSGSVTKWGDSGLNSYDYSLVMNDGNVAAGQQFRVNAQSLLAGEDFIFNGAAETNGRFLVYAGFGVDSLTGGSGNDIFYFEAGRFGAGDTINGGGGTDAVVISGGTLAQPGALSLYVAAGSFTSIESLSFNARFASDPTAAPSYDVTLANGNVASGAWLIVNGSSLGAGQALTFNGSAETQGNFTIYGGAGHDALYGGAGNDFFYGAGGSDTLFGGGGNNTFQYRDVLDSTTSAYDQIGNFVSGSDRIDLAYIDANTATGGDDAFSFIGNAAFSNVAGQLRADFNAGGNYWTVQGDVNGDGVADFQLLVGGTQLLATDFTF